MIIRYMIEGRGRVQCTVACERNGVLNSQGVGVGVGVGVVLISRRRRS